MQVFCICMLAGCPLFRYIIAMRKGNEKYKDLLKKFKLKATDQRLEVLRVLDAGNKPMTLKEIIKKMKVASAHEVTIYRALAFFVSNGLVRQINFETNVPYFELADHEHDHHHVLCTRCKKVNDFIGCGIDKLVKKALSQAKDFRSIQRHSFELFGICKQCAK